MPTQNEVSSLPPRVPLTIGKFKASRMIVRESWSVLNQDKELLLFPVLSSIFSILALAVVASIYFFVILGGSLATLENENQMNVTSYAVLFVWYFIVFFITNFFQAGMYLIVDARFKGGNLSLGDGIKAAFENAPKIALWSLISSTVGLVLRIIADNSKIIGKIVAMIFGAAWNILTYFSLPSLIIGKKSIKDSFHESAAIIRKTWGETIIINLGVGLVFGLLFFAVFGVGVTLFILFPTIKMGIAIGIFLLLAVILLSIVSSCLGAIFKLALYEYASTGNIPQGFSPELIQNAVKSK
ncbi:MAG: DUF6159 family protein [Candidatus Taylorbacteria bacterium]